MNLIRGRGKIHPWPHPNMRNRKAMTITFFLASFVTATEHYVTHIPALLLQGRREFITELVVDDRMHLTLALPEISETMF
jgi:hypothetical protein